MVGDEASANSLKGQAGGGATPCSLSLSQEGEKDKQEGNQRTLRGEERTSIFRITERRRPNGKEKGTHDQPWQQFSGLLERRLISEILEMTKRN